jgi:hypothetical protein
MIAKTDFVLLHPPSLYDFRKSPVMHGPISDVVPSTPIFEFYPIGFVSISEYLERHGFRVRIINVALKMLKKPRLDVERLIASLNPRLFGLDLHWMAHIQGALALAEIIKRHHPKTPVILGGLSATYYHEEILERYRQVDFVARGDSTEEPLRRLLDVLRDGKDFQEIPNLSWRDVTGKIHINPLSYVPDNLDHIAIDYRHIMKKVVRYLDPFGYEPFFNWFTYPVTAAICWPETFSTVSIISTPRSWLLVIYFSQVETMGSSFSRPLKRGESRITSLLSSFDLRQERNSRKSPRLSPISTSRSRPSLMTKKSGTASEGTTTISLWKK